MERKSFLDQEPPPGYVAGVGRGASGFSTSADSGPVQFQSAFGNEADDNDDGLLGQMVHRSAEDEEADRIYDEIEMRLQKRSRHEDLSTERSTDVIIPTGHGTIKQQFSLLKQDLAQVSMDEWAALPEVGDLTRKNKRQRLLDQQLQRTYAAPDTLIASSGQKRQLTATQDEVTISDIESWEKRAVNLTDLEKSRLVMASLRMTQPLNPELWLSSAKVEEDANNLEEAREFVAKGCALNPSSDDLWLENIRLNRAMGTRVCKAIMSNALQHKPTSERLWMAAIELENSADYNSRRKIAMKALEYIPDNKKLWQLLVDLESSEEDKARILTRATDLCKDHWPFWLALVDLLEHAEAKKILNKARKALNKERMAWVNALQQEEKGNELATIEKLTMIMTRGLHELSKNGVSRSLEEWLQDSVNSLESGYPKTARAIANAALSQSEADLVLLADHLSTVYPLVAAFILGFITEKNPQAIRLWIKLFGVLKANNDSSLYETYHRAIEANPQNEILPLMLAKDQWLVGDIVSARKTLSEACEKFPGSEQVWVARMKFEVRTAHLSEACGVSKAALVALRSSSRLWYKHIHILRACQLKGLDSVTEEDVEKKSQEAVELHTHEKLFLQRSQILLSSGRIPEARDLLSAATKTLPKSPLLWLLLSDIDMSNGAIARARSVLDSALLNMPAEPSLWIAKIELEVSQGDLIIARQLINKTLKQFPSSADVWILHLKMIPKMSHRKTAFLDALRQTNNSSDILLAIGWFFWVDGKFSKAKSWFDRALATDKTNGDAYAWLYCFEKEHGIDKELHEITQNLIRNHDSIKRGKAWNSVAKDPKHLGSSPEALVEIVASALLTTTILH